MSDESSKAEREISSNDQENETSSKNRPARKVRSALRRALSDRVLKIIDFSQQHIDLEKMMKKSCSNDSTEPIIEKSNDSAFSQITDFNDRKSLIKYCREVYEGVIENCLPIIQSAKIIVASLLRYFEKSDAAPEKKVDAILRKKFLKNHIEIKHAYSGQFLELSKFKIESQLQIFLRLENYLISADEKTSEEIEESIDGDFVWELANSIRCLAQTVKDRFKIERFLRDELCPTYKSKAPRLVKALLEELGYTKEDESNVSNVMFPSKLATTPTQICSQNQNTLSININVVSEAIRSILEKPPLPAKNSPKKKFLNKKRSMRKFSRPNSHLFEELLTSKQTRRFNEFEKLKKEKLNRFGRFLLANTFENRSILVQRKEIKLKIRSPYKSPSKSMPKKDSNPIQEFRSPFKFDRKSCSSILISDTPDHKQNQTKISERQEEVMRRFSIRPYNPNQRPSIPSTPLKGDFIYADSIV